MRFLCFFWLFCFLNLSFSQSDRTQQHSSKITNQLFSFKKFSSEIDSLISSSDFKNHIGISIARTHNDSLSQNKYNYRQQIKFTPASVLKLILTTTALHFLNKNTYASNQINLNGIHYQDTFQGFVSLIGNGDPHFSDLSSPTVFSTMNSFVELLKKAGIQNIIGDIITIDTLFGTPKLPSTWKPHHAYFCYGSKVSALTFQRNCFQASIIEKNKKLDVQIFPKVGFIHINNQVEVGGKKDSLNIDWNPISLTLTLTGAVSPHFTTVKSFPRWDTETYFTQAFLTACEQQGIQVHLEPNLIPLQANYDTTLTLKTKPLLNIIPHINQQSQNLQAEMLLRHLGFFIFKKANIESGIKAERQFLKKLNLPQEDFILHDGSGLSYDNKVTPNGITSLLQRVKNQPYFKSFWNSLAIPTIHGFDRNRLKNLSKQIRWKTGYLNEVQTASGYLFNNLDTLAFSILINHPQKSYSQTSQFLDSILTIMATSNFLLP